jgi:hypothetical protein
MPTVTPYASFFPPTPKSQGHKCHVFGILLRITYPNNLKSGTDGTSKGHPAARTKLRPAGNRRFWSTDGGNYE